MPGQIGLKVKFVVLMLEIWFQNGLNAQFEQQENKNLTEQITKLNEQNRLLKEEYEKYKIRTNYLIKSVKQSSKVSSKKSLYLFFILNKNFPSFNHVTFVQ